jgi:hypothetical protein
MTIADHPLHGSGRAALPHPALALGGRRQALVGIGMTDTRDREPARHQAAHPLPRHERGLTATHQGDTPQPRERSVEGGEARTVARHAVVPRVSHNDRAQISTLVRNRVVQALSQFEFDRAQLGAAP